MDVHTTNYTLCAFSLKDQKAFHRVQIEPDIKYFKNYMKKTEELVGDKDVLFVCGYEAGCLGFSLYYEIEKLGYQCVILAPTTMAKSTKSVSAKNDKRDALTIAQCLAYQTFSPVYIPHPKDEAIRAFLRMRGDLVDSLKDKKRQTIAFCTAHGYNYHESNKKLSYWTQKHTKYINSIKFDEYYLERTLTEYMEEVDRLNDKIAKLDEEIMKIAGQERYKEKVNALRCFRGIETYTALSIICEISDFNRFPTAGQFAAYLGLVPGERSSGNHIHYTGITKAGNGNLRRLLTEACQSYSKVMTAKTKALRRKQADCGDAAIIAYADKGNRRLLNKFLKMKFSGRKYNIAKTAVARELACFIWGMMTGHINLPDEPEEAGTAAAATETAVQTA